MIWIRTRVLFCLLAVAMPVPGLATSDLAAPVRVFAAASLRDVLEAAVIASGQPVVVSYAGSGALARQVDQGAPADLVILANTKWMDWLIGRGVITGDQVSALAGNRLVLAAAKGTPPLTTADLAGLAQRLGDGRLAVGQVESVPAGIYARQWLQHAGLWQALRAHLAETENVRAALLLLTRGEVPLAVVYASDIKNMEDVIPVYDIPQDSHDPIVYPMASLSPRGADFAQFLRSAAGQGLFREQGFAPAPVTP